MERKANSEFEVQLYIDNLDAGGLCHAFHCGVGREDLGCSPSRRMAPSCIEAQDVSRISQQAGPGRSSADTISQEALGEERFVKCWVGFLRGDLCAHLQPLQVMTDCDINFGSYKELFLIPAAEIHIAAANQHFAFFSAEEGEDNQAEEEADQEQNIKLHQKAEMLARPSRESHAHRETWEILTSGVHRLLDHAKKEKAPTQHAGATLPPPAVSGKTASFPHLDQGVAQAALQAGTPHHSLLQMEKLGSQNHRAKKVVDQHKDIVLDPLSEDEKLEKEPSGSGSPVRDQLGDSLAKLTAIVELLAEDKRKAKSGPKLEQAFQSASSSDGA